MKKKRLIRSYAAIIFCLIFANHVIAQQLKLLLPVVSNKKIDHIYISADKQKLIASTFSTQGVSEIKVWDIRSGKLLYTIKNNFIVQNSVYQDKTGLKLLSNDESHINVWNLADGTLLYRLKQSDPVDFASFTHNGKQLITTNKDSVKVWEAENGRFSHVMTGGTAAMYPAVLSDDDQYLGACYKGSVVLWSLAEKKISAAYRAAPDYYGKYYSENSATNIAFSKNNHFLFSHFFDGTLNTRDVEKPENSLSKLNVKDFQIAGNLKYYATIADQKITVVNIDSNKIVFEKFAGNAFSDVVTLSSTGIFLVETIQDRGDYNYYTHIYDVNSKEEADSILTQAYFRGGPALVQGDSAFVFARTMGDQDELFINRMAKGRHIGPAQHYASQSKSFLAFISTEKPGLFASFAGDSTVTIWNINDNKPANNIRLNSPVPAAMNANTIVEVLKSTDNTGNGKDTLLTRELLSGKYVKKIPVTNSTGKITFNTAGSLMAADRGIMDNSIDIIDTKLGKVVQTITKTNSNPVISATFVPNSSRLIFSDNVLNFDLKLYDIRTGKLDLTLKNSENADLGFGDVITNYACSVDSRYVATISAGRILIWDLILKKIVKEIKSPLEFLNAVFTSDGKYFIYGMQNGVIVITDLKWNQVKNLTAHTSQVYQLITDQESSLLVSQEVTGKTIITDLKTFKQLISIEPPEGNSIINIDFSDHKVYFSDGSVISVYAMIDGRKIISFAALSGKNQFYLSSQNYYSASPVSSAMLAWKSGGNILSFEQLDAQYNRPDKVLQAVGSTDTALIHAYHKAYQKRIKKLRIDTQSFQNSFKAPLCDFKNREEIDYEQKQERLKLHIYAVDSTCVLSNFNVWINQVPVYGIKGICLKRSNKRTVDTTVTVTLSQGENRVETSVTDASGAESYHSPLYVKYTPDKPTDTLMYFVGIGIDHFADNKYNLQWSVKDIHDLALKFKEKYGDNCKIDTLFNEHVTIDSVIALKKKLLKTGVNDKVIIAYSGHGLLSNDYDYYLSGYDINFDKPEKGGIPYDALENLLDSIPARKKLMLIDACNSGEVDKEELAHYTVAEAGLDSAGVHKGVKMLIDPNHKIGMKNSFELMKELFVNVGKSTGATIISAAGGTQFALEKGDLKNGVFTYSILEYLKQPHCTISALKQHVNSRVTELTKGIQVPTTRAENSLVDWEVW